MSIDELPYELDPLWGCHNWQGKLNSNGRPVIWRGSKPQSVIRIVMGDIPDELVPDHLCRNVLCIRKEHLEAVTQSENEKRKSWSFRCKRTKCPRGHSMEHAIVTPWMGRLCRTCHVEQRKELNDG